MNVKMSSILGAVAFALVVVAALGAGFYLYMHRQGGERATNSRTLPGAPEIGGSFSLTDDTGRPVSEKTLVGEKYHLIFFGFAHCPDICPGMLTTMAGVYEKLPPATRGKLQMVFVSVDPDRDSAEKLHEFVRGFDPSFVGWRGSQAEVDAMTKNYLAYAAKRADPDAPDGYTMDHSAILYLMGPDGKYVMHMRNSDSATLIRERLEEVVR